MDTRFSRLKESLDASYKKKEMLINKVAVYGSLKKGHYNNQMLDRCKFIGETKTEAKFTMYSLGAFPMVVQHGDTSITIEVYEVDAIALGGLDRLETSPSFYQRKLIKTEFGPVWMYTREPECLTEGACVPDVIQSGNWKRGLIK